jgi:threonine dehydrogenase-like Zn-dependent dehydrogenase
VRYNAAVSTTIESGPGSTLAAAEVAIAVIGSALGAHPGGELVGRVEAAGESAQHLLGQAVVVPRLLPCGECAACRRLRIASCPTRRQLPTRPQARLTLPARFLIPLQPPYLTTPPASPDLYRYAALSDGLLAPYSGLVTAGVSPGTLCVVLGSGARAGLAVVVARMLGMQVVALCTNSDERQRLIAPPYGALHTLDPQQLDVADLQAALAELTQQSGLPSHGLTLLETSGSDGGRTRALSLLAAGATAILLDRSTPLDAPASAPPSLAAPLPVGPQLGAGALLNRLVDEGCQILGAGPAHPDLLPELLALVERAGIDLGALTRAVDESELESLMAARRRGEGDQLTLPIVCYPTPAASLAG